MSRHPSVDRTGDAKFTVDAMYRAELAGRSAVLLAGAAAIILAILEHVRRTVG